MRGGPIDPVIGVILLDADIAREIALRQVFAARMSVAHLLQIHRHVLRELLDNRPAVDQKRFGLTLFQLGFAHRGEDRMADDRLPGRERIGQHVAQPGGVAGDIL